MKVFVTLALLATFGAAVFVPRDVIGVPLYWSLFLVMFLLLALYWFLAYWVNRKAAATAIGESPHFSLHCAKVPVAGSEDLVRGRLCVTDKQLVLVQKMGTRQYQVVWSVPLSTIQQLSYVKFSMLKTGFILIVESTSQEPFLSSFAKHKTKLLRKHLHL